MKIEVKRSWLLWGAPTVTVELDDLENLCFGQGFIKRVISSYEIKAVKLNKLKK